MYWKEWNEMWKDVKVACICPDCELGEPTFKDCEKCGILKELYLKLPKRLHSRARVLVDKFEKYKYVANICRRYLTVDTSPLNESDIKLLRQFIHRAWRIFKTKKKSRR